MRGSAVEMPARSTWVSLVDAGLAEDLGPGDATSDAVLDAETSGTARIEAREAIVLSGLSAGESVVIEGPEELRDGQRVESH